MITKHYGVIVDSEVPVTGVIDSNRVSQFVADNMSECINLDFEEHILTCPNEDHTDCFYDGDEVTLLIGAWKNDKKEGLYEPDKEKEGAEFSAIVGPLYTQVLWSKYTVRCALCSPCYPGQGDIGSTGDYLTFTLPPDTLTV